MLASLRRIKSVSDNNPGLDFSSFLRITVDLLNATSRPLNQCTKRLAPPRTLSTATLSPAADTAGKIAARR